MKKSQVKVGEVLHYYDKLDVAVVRLTSSDLKIGDRIQLKGKNGQDFIQKVESMQIEHAHIDIAKAGDEFGLKTDKKVKEDSLVFKFK